MLLVSYNATYITVIMVAVMEVAMKCYDRQQECSTREPRSEERQLIFKNMIVDNFHTLF